MADGKTSPVCGTTLFLKRRTGRGQTPGPLNNDLISAHYALDTTPAGAEVNKTSAEVQSSIRLQVYPDLKFKKFGHTWKIIF